ncbi:MAG TPA: ATP-binding protein, partial [Pyrinomonadaceae bacterium]|nr:ATP-binding protein [Pyrinomonadaceae bacterium]
KVKISEQTRDLIARQFDGNPAFIKYIFQAASERKADLDSFRQVEQVYTDELLGGRIAKFYDSIFRRAAPDVEMQKTIIETLNDAVIDKTEPERRRVNDILKSRKDSGISSPEDFYRLLSLLNTQEILRLSSNFIEPMSENEILSDYLRARYRFEIAAENRALVVGEMLSDFLKRAPKTMAKFYRQSLAINLRALLSVFNCQEPPASLLDYSVFKDRHKGASDAEILESETEKIRLPQIVYTAYTDTLYAPFGQVAEKTRSAVAVGFEESAYTNENEIVWIAAEIESKLEATKETAEFWCDRLEMVAVTCNFLKYKFWLVAPEGFAPEAIDVLRRRNAFGSSRKQVELLTKFLNAENEINKNQTADEYEIIMPMGDDTELIAANAVEEIARRHAFEPKAINQIKTALVEACINATEHSLSPDRKIYQKFTFADDKIVITISNRGLRFAGKESAEIKSVEGRRGWGLKLMRTLMDEVKFEQVEDGTRISMTKYLKK